MKKLILSFLLTGSIATVNSQVFTTDFETWQTTVSSNQDPNGWISPNVIVLLGNPQSVFQLTNSIDVHGGTKAAKITTIELTNNPLASYGIPDTLGFILTGQVNISGPSLVEGQPYTNRPTHMNFWYKSLPQATDTCGVRISLWKRVSGVKTIIATAEWQQGATMSSYTQASIPLIYDATNGGLTPDSISVFMASSYKRTQKGMKLGSEFWVDDITFTGVAGVKSYDNSTDVSVYPNPANSVLTIATTSKEAKQVVIYDLTGKVIANQLLEDGKIKISVQTYPLGLYLYSILGTNKQVLTTGKFHVAH